MYTKSFAKIYKRFTYLSDKSNISDGVLYQKKVQFDKLLQQINLGNYNLGEGEPLKLKRENPINFEKLYWLDEIKKLNIQDLDWNDADVFKTSIQSYLRDEVTQSENKQILESYLACTEPYATKKEGFTLPFDIYLDLKNIYYSTQEDESNTNSYSRGTYCTLTAANNVYTYPIKAVMNLDFGDSRIAVLPGEKAQAKLFLPSKNNYDPKEEYYKSIERLAQTYLSIHRGIPAQITINFNGVEESEQAELKKKFVQALLKQTVFAYRDKKIYSDYKSPKTSNIIVNNQNLRRVFTATKQFLSKDNGEKVDDKVAFEEFHKEYVAELLPESAIEYQQLMADSPIEVEYLNHGRTNKTYTKQILASVSAFEVSDCKEFENVRDDGNNKWFTQQEMQEFETLSKNPQYQDAVVGFQFRVYNHRNKLFHELASIKGQKDSGKQTSMIKKISKKYRLDENEISTYIKSEAELITNRDEGSLAVEKNPSVANSAQGA